MNNEDRSHARNLRGALRNYSKDVQPMPGIDNDSALNAFIFQIIESVRRIRFVKEVAKRDISPQRKNPNCDLFDPIRAAMLDRRGGNFEEACWLVFIFTHFGKNGVSGFRLLRDIYGKLGHGSEWTWLATKADPVGFRHWLDANLTELRSGTVHRAFGNHRKYQSLDPWKPNGTGAAVESYVAWISKAGSHSALFESIAQATDNDPEKGFRTLYRSMTAVSSFGRTARFDYLSMIGKLELANIRPDSVHFGAATGPVAGAKLLFFGSAHADRSILQLEKAADQLASYLQLDKQIMEDSLCNWQKSPTIPVGFRG
jgi:hypothetical protein